MITVSAFKSVPPFAQGLVRDLRVRWALEEAGIPYAVELIGRDDQASPAYRAQQPFGQVPVMRDGSLTLFESGAIVLHIGDKSEAILPHDEAGRARAITWVFAALNSIEPFIMDLVNVDIFSNDAAISAARRPEVAKMIEQRLSELAEHLKGREWLEDRFTIGDLMMVTVLRILRHTDMVERCPILGPYKTRGEARPGFQRALQAQMDDFKASS